MSSELTELEIVQNPALGAYALWRFGVGYQTEDGRPPPLPLAFLVLPLLLHQPTLKMIASTQKASGLTLFAAKLGQERENLLAVHERALALRRLSLQSIAMGVDHRLLTLDYNAVTLRANTADESLKSHHCLNAFVASRALRISSGTGFPSLAFVKWRPLSPWSSDVFSTSQGRSVATLRRAAACTRPQAGACERDQWGFQDREIGRDPNH